MASQADDSLSAAQERKSHLDRSRWEIDQSVKPSRLSDDEEEPEPGYLRYSDIVMDLAALRAKRGDRYVQLNPTEFRLLRLLLQQPERAFTREQLKTSVWGYGANLDPRSISVYLGRLRRALTACGEPNVIRTIAGYGYSLDATCPDIR